MPVTVIVGGQFGSEGKGKVAHDFARRQGASIAVRVGGSNSGHTVIDRGIARVFRHLPTAAILPDVLCVIPAGSYIDPDVLLGEVSSIDLWPERLVIDPNAVLITEREKQEEAASGLRDKIGSTASGTGAAVQRRIARNGSACFVASDERLARYVRPTRPLMRARLDRGERIIVEGTQGFGLSLLHSQAYPNVTSRDTTAAGFISEAGLSPLDVDDVILVIRAFPIRVAGNSGDLPLEIDWDTIAKEGGHRQELVERTSVTGKIRRAARFHPDVVRAAIEANQPTRIVLNHVDYVDSNCGSFGGLTAKADAFVRDLEAAISLRVDLVGISASSLLEHADSSMNSTLAV